MKVHIVRYTPRTGSRTAQLLEHAVSQLDPAAVTVTDLAARVPPVFDQRTVDAYIQRNYAGQTLDAEAAQGLAPMDRYVEALRAADHVILATPMYNFALPGAVKAWFDAIIQKDQDALTYVRDNTEMEVIELTPEERAAWVESAAPVREKYLESAGPLGQKLIEEVNKL